MQEHNPRSYWQMGPGVPSGRALPRLPLAAAAGAGLLHRHTSVCRSLPRHWLAVEYIWVLVPYMTYDIYVMYLCHWHKSLEKGVAEKKHSLASVRSFLLRERLMVTHHLFILIVLTPVAQVRAANAAPRGCPWVSPRTVASQRVLPLPNEPRSLRHCLLLLLASSPQMSLPWSTGHEAQPGVTASCPLLPGRAASSLRPESFPWRRVPPCSCAVLFSHLRPTCRGSPLTGLLGWHHIQCPCSQGCVWQSIAAWQEP